MTTARIEPASDNPPTARVIAYLDAIDEHDARSRMQYGESVHTFNDIPLNRSDLRDLVAELVAADELIERVLNGQRETARRALAGWRRAIEGDSGDAELDAGSELADIVASVFEITDTGGEQ